MALYLYHKAAGIIFRVFFPSFLMKSLCVYSLWRCRRALQTTLFQRDWCDGNNLHPPFPQHRNTCVLSVEVPAVHGLEHHDSLNHWSPYITDLSCDYMEIERLRKMRTSNFIIWLQLILCKPERSSSENIRMGKNNFLLKKSGPHHCLL